jgi:hypothetical protein
MLGFGHHEDKKTKTVVTVEQDRNAVQGHTTSSSSTASNIASNVANTASNVVHNAVAGLTSGTHTSHTSTASNIAMHSTNSNLPTTTRTAETVISSASAPIPTKEYTEFVQLPKVVENTQVQTQYQAQNVQEETIKLKQQPIQVIEQPSVIKTQPIITHKQVVEVEQERPIELVKKTLGHETLPAIEKKEVLIQGVRAPEQGVSMTTKTVVENGQTVTYEVRGGAADVKVIEALSTSGVRSEQGVIDRVKEAVGGTRTHADNLIQVAREKASNVLHSDVKSSNYNATTTGSNMGATQTTVTVDAPAGSVVKKV